MKVLVALDDSEPSWDAAVFAGRLLSDDDHVLVLNVASAAPAQIVAAGGLVGYPAAYAAPPVTDPVGDETAVDEARQRLRPAADRAHADEVRVEFGAVVERIRAVAEAEQIELIVVGTHDRSAFGRLFGGSVSNDLAKDSPCPVLIVR